MTSLSLRVIQYDIFQKHLKKIILKGFNVNENRKRDWGCVTIVRTPHLRTAGRQCIHILHSIQPTCHSSSRSDTTTPDTFYPSNFLFFCSQFQTITRLPAAASLCLERKSTSGHFVWEMLRGPALLCTSERAPCTPTLGSGAVWGERAWTHPQNWLDAGAFSLSGALNPWCPFRPLQRRRWG